MSFPLSRFPFFSRQQNLYFISYTPLCSYEIRYDFVYGDVQQHEKQRAQKVVLIHVLKMKENFYQILDTAQYFISPLQTETLHLSDHRLLNALVNIWADEKRRHLNRLGSWMTTLTFGMSNKNKMHIAALVSGILIQRFNIFYLRLCISRWSLHPHVRWRDKEFICIRCCARQKIKLRHVSVNTYLENGQSNINNNIHYVTKAGMYMTPTSTADQTAIIQQNIISEITTLFDNLSPSCASFTIVTIPIVISTCSTDYE